MQFHDNLDEAFKSDIMPYRELPLGDYKILQQTLTPTSEDDRECLILKLINKNQEEFTTFAPERIKTDLTRLSYNYLRHLGLKQSKSTGNDYFDYKLALLKD